MASVSQIVSVDDFYEPKHQTIYEAIIGKFSASEPADAVTVANRLSDSGDLDKVGGIDYLHSLIASVPTAANASYYAEIVHQRALLRRVIASGTKIAQLGYDAEGSQAQDVINMAQAEVYEMSTGRVRQDYAPVQAAVHDALDQIDSIQKGELQAGVPTGFQEIDEVTKGLQPGQMVVVAGRPAMGKSTLGVDFARSAAIHHHDTTILFSLEMSKVELAQRIISAETGVPLAALRNADDIDPNRWNTLNNFYARLQDAPLFIDDSPNMSLMEIRAKCRRLKQSERPQARRDRLPAAHDLGQGRGKPPAGGLRVLASTQAACQGARGAGGGVRASSTVARKCATTRNRSFPTCANPAPSSRTPTWCSSVHRPDFYDEEDRPGEADIIMAKHRNGPTRTFGLVFQGQYSRFSDMNREV